MNERRCGQEGMLAFGVAGKRHPGCLFLLYMLVNVFLAIEARAYACWKISHGMIFFRRVVFSCNKEVKSGSG